MDLPMIAPAPVVTALASVFRSLFDNQCQLRPFQPSLTGLMVWLQKRLAYIARGVLDRAEKTHLSRLFSDAPGREEAIKRRRVRFMRQQTTPHRRRRRESLLAIDETLCEHVGALFDDVDRHDHPSDGTSPLAHHPVTSFDVSGPVRLPLRLYRRDEEQTPWEAAVAMHVPTLQSPTERKTRNRLHQQVDPVWLQAPELRGRHEPFRTTIALAIEWAEEAIRHKGPFGVVVFDAWYVAEDAVRALARRPQDWISLLTTNRLLETAPLHLWDANGWTLQLPGPHIAVAELVPLIPANAYRPLRVHEQTYGCFTRVVRIPGLGKIRIVVSSEPEQLTERYVVLVTNRADWSAATIIGLYLQWPTATFYQDSQGHRGFNEYRMRSIEALGTHWCVVCVAYVLWHLTCLPAGSDRTRGLIQTIGDACRQQGRALLQKLLLFVHDQLAHGVPVDHLFAHVFAKQRGMVLT